MKKTTNQTSNSFLKLYCNIFGHNYIISKKVTHYVKEYTCSHCKHELTTNSNGNLVELSPIFREINDTLSTVHKKKIIRLS